MKSISQGNNCVSNFIINITFEVGNFRFDFFIFQYTWQVQSIKNFKFPR